MRALSWLPLALIGCAEGDSDTDSPPPMLEPGGCEAAPYAWLPADQVGAVRAFEEDGLSPIASTTLDALIASAGASWPPAPYGARVFRYRYTTQDKGEPVEATALIGVPWREEGVVGPFPAMLALHGTTGFTNACAPSAMGLDGVALIALFTSQGYVVVAPDYIGLDADAAGSAPIVHHAYLNIEQTAIGSLDALRAAEALITDPAAAIEADLSGQTVIWGASQGGHAAFSVDLLAPYYAPEQQIVASVAAVPATDLSGLAEYAVSSWNPATGAIGAFLVAQSRWYGGGDLSTLLVDDLDSALPAAMDASCSPGDAFAGFDEPADVYTATFLDAGPLGADPWACYLTENTPRTSGIERLTDTPTLFVLGESDDLVYTPVEREDFDDLCEAGWALEYLECARAGHTEGAVWSLQEQMTWLSDRVAGEPFAADCARTAPVDCSGE